jgi:superfamily II DNA or RNA helicase
MELRNYQKNVMNKVLLHLENNNRCCVQLATGSGKTALFSKLVEDLEGRVLICVHREELVVQTSNTLTLDHDLLIPKIKHVSKDIIVAMVQTLNNRIKKGLINLDSFDYLIIDECHRGEFMKILDQFTGKVIGFTATPNFEKSETFYKCLSCGDEVYDSKKCCTKQNKKFRRVIPLSKYYHTLIEGVDIHELIEQGYLVKDENYIFDVDTTRLVYDPRIKDYTEESVSLVFGSPEAIRNTIRVYKELALNRKTILFNPNTLVNKRLYKAMLACDLPVKMFDSNNSDENRHELVEWFKNTPNAILLNVQVFTTGFDCTDVEVVFLNKKTASINLYLQMVGRGGRITNKIYKPSFRVIDLGNNNSDFGAWSDSRDWKHYFYHSECKEVGAPRPASIRMCHACEAVNAANSLVCENCGVERLYTGGVIGLPKLNGKPVIPSPESIINFCKNKNYDMLTARKIVYSTVAEMFKDISYQTFSKHKASGELYFRAKKFLAPYYFEIQRSGLEGNVSRTFDSFINETIKQIERGYITSKTV